MKMLSVIIQLGNYFFSKSFVMFSVFKNIMCYYDFSLVCDYVAYEALDGIVFGFEWIVD